ncbi:ethylene-responsive transcription factor ERF027-like [Silene latifolia]|uniref:ethylene-responsive transcription factor ERF027-like n=1 Tax=Silene latifolia TaxID=37657 RepID=UPI003D7737D7
MAGAAYDVAALALKGSEAVLNFPDYVSRYPVPATNAPGDIREAAAAAADMRRPEEKKTTEETTAEKGGGSGGGGGKVEEEEEFVDIEALFDMPNLLVDMAGGMMVSPPRLTAATGDDYDDDYYDGCYNLWSYDK